MNLIPKLENHNGMYVVSSRTIANHLEKRHYNVLRDIENLISSDLRILKNQSAKISADLEKWLHIEKKPI